MTRPRPLPVLFWVLVAAAVVAAVELKVCFYYRNPIAPWLFCAAFAFGAGIAIWQIRSSRRSR